MTSALAGGLFGALQAAQQRIGDEINDFKQEAAQTEVWKQEEERRKSLQVDLATPPPQKQPADGYIASTSVLKMTGTLLPSFWLTSSILAIISSVDLHTVMSFSSIVPESPLTIVASK